MGDLKAVETGDLGNLEVRNGLSVEFRKVTKLDEIHPPFTRLTL